MPLSPGKGAEDSLCQWEGSQELPRPRVLQLQDLQPHGPGPGAGCWGVCKLPPLPAHQLLVKVLEEKGGVSQAFDLHRRWAALDVLTCAHARGQDRALAEAELRGGKCSSSSLRSKPRNPLGEGVGMMGLYDNQPHYSVRRHYVRFYRLLDVENKQ